MGGGSPSSERVSSLACRNSQSRNTISFGRSAVACDEHARTIEDRAVDRIDAGNTGGVEPRVPGRAIIKMQQRQIEQIVRPPQADGKLWATYCKEMFGA